jgi:TAT (twin-arginine translocation) pathway signal sequence
LHPRDLSRRNFIKGSAAVTGGIAISLSCVDKLSWMECCVLCHRSGFCDRKICGVVHNIKSIVKAIWRDLCDIESKRSFSPEQFLIQHDVAVFDIAERTVTDVTPAMGMDMQVNIAFEVLFERKANCEGNF